MPTAKELCIQGAFDLGASWQEAGDYIRARQSQIIAKLLQNLDLQNEAMEGRETYHKDLLVACREAINAALYADNGLSLEKGMELLHALNIVLDKPEGVQT